MSEFRIFHHKHLNKMCINFNTHILFYCPLIQMPFAFLFFTIAEFMIARMCKGIRVEVGARIHDEMSKVLTGELRA